MADFGGEMERHDRCFRGRRGLKSRRVPRLRCGREAAGSPSYTASPYFNKSSAYPTDTYTTRRTLTLEMKVDDGLSEKRDTKPLPGDGARRSLGGPEAPPRPRRGGRLQSD